MEWNSKQKPPDVLEVAAAQTRGPAQSVSWGKAEPQRTPRFCSDRGGHLCTPGGIAAYSLWFIKQTPQDVSPPCEDGAGVGYNRACFAVPRIRA
jgi:hypothetical protein